MSDEARGHDRDDKDGRDAASDADRKDERQDGDDADRDEADGDDAPKKTPAYKKPLFWIILIAVVAALLIGGTLYWLHARQYESTDDAFVDTANQNN